MALIEPGRFVRISNDIIFLAKRVEKGEMKDIVAHEGVDSDKPVRTIVAERGKILMDENTGQLEVHLFNGSVSETSEKDKGIQSVQFETYKFPTLAEDDIRKMGKKKKDMTLAELLVDLSEQPDKKDRRELWALFHKRIAFGIPIATIVKRGEIIISFGISMVAACLYYILFAIAQSLATRSGIPPVICLWMPNVLLCGAGFYLLRKAVLS